MIAASIFIVASVFNRKTVRPLKNYRFWIVIAVLVSMVESFGEKYKIGKSIEEINRITTKLEKNLREHVERSTELKAGRKHREEDGPGKFVIKPKPTRDSSLHF